MFDMDFKGMNWVGNMYQKFETMVQEVEDIMCQETAKYVENQVQNVGASVKKFYSEVMQDLLPPSSLDPVKDNTLGLSLGKVADFATYEKSKLPFEEDLIKENPKTHKILGKTTEEVLEQSTHKSSKTGFKEDPSKEMPPPLHTSETTSPAEKYLSEATPLSKVHDKKNSPPPSSMDTTSGEDPEISLEQDDGVEMHKMPCVPGGSMKKMPHAFKVSQKTAPVIEDSCQKRSVHKKSKAVAEENSTKEKPVPVNVYGVTDPNGEDSSQASTLNKTHSLPPSSWDPITRVNPILSSEWKDDAGTFKNLNVPDAPTINEKQPPLEVSNLITPAGKGQGQVTSLSELLCDTHEEACSLVMDISNPTSVEPVVWSSHRETGPNGRSFVVEHIADNSGIGNAIITDSSWNGTEDQSDCADLDTYMAQLETEITGRFDNSEVDGGADPVEQLNEPAEEFRNTNLEDSCIVVDSKELYFVPHRPGKQRSYKKKIHDALTSRLKSVKKREYEQLAIWCRGIDSQEKTEISATSAIKDSNSRNLSTHDVQDSEWELL